MNYSPGDRVLLREKNSLVNEYGVSPDGAIRRGFCPQMMAYCGRIGVVVSASYSLYSISFEKNDVPYTYPDSVIVRKVE